MSADPKLSIVIPVFNEEEILEREVIAICARLSEALPAVAAEVVIVENGSHDRTLAIAHDLAQRYPPVRVIALPQPSYGLALRAGIEGSRGEYVLLCNIDFWDIPFLQRALEESQVKNLDVVVGSKTMAGAKDFRSPLRRSITRTFNFMLRAVLGYHGTDTHGMKLLRREAIVPVVKQCRTNREVFDTELMLRAQRRGLRLGEIPVECREIRQSTYGILRRIPRTIEDLTILVLTLHQSK